MRRLLQPRGGDLGADRRSHREKERQRSKRVEIVDAPRLGEIAVEHDVRGGGEPALEQVHQQEGEVVEHVARRDDVAELDGVEQHRLAVDQHDIAEMQIAVDAADEAAASALAQQRDDAVVGGAARARERIDLAPPGRCPGAAPNASTCSSM